MRSEALSDLAFECSVAPATLRSADNTSRFDRFVRDALGRIVEHEILPRFNNLHPSASSLDLSPRQPTPDEVERINKLLLSVETPDLEGEVANLVGRGMSLDTLLVDLLAPAARHLGVLWERDLCDFMAVTIGLGRLHILTQHLCAELEERPARAERLILLVPSPGETHLYALSIVASFFRKAGWDVVLAERARPDAARILRQNRFDAVGLSLSCDLCLPAMRNTVAALRRSSTNPALAVIVGGPWVARNEVEARDIDADLCIVDGQAAPRLTEGFLTKWRQGA